MKRREGWQFSLVFIGLFLLPTAPLRKHQQRIWVSVTLPQLLVFPAASLGRPCILNPTAGNRFQLVVFENTFQEMVETVTEIASHDCRVRVRDSSKTCTCGRHS